MARRSVKRSSWCVLVLSCLPLTIAASPATVPSNTWVTGGRVNAAVRVGYHLYIGGDFGGIYPAAAPPGNYYIAIRAVNACGTSPRSSEAVATVGGVTPPPPAPTNLQTQISGGAITLTWASSGPLATSYVVDAGSSPGASDLASGIGVGLVTERTFTGVPRGAYYIRVRALGLGGSSLPSTDVQVVVQ